MNLGKQAISFGMGVYLLDWILTTGYVTVILERPSRCCWRIPCGAGVYVEREMRSEGLR